MKGRDWVCFRGKLQENQTGDASWFLGLYILSYYMYMFVSDLLILVRAGILEINNMMLWSHPKGLYFNGLSQFFSFLPILSDHFRLWTMRRFSMRTHLSHTLHIFTNTCLPHGKPCSIKLDLILNSSFPCCAWLYCHTHAHHTCSMLLFHSATAMRLHHAFNLCYACPRPYR